MSFDIVVVVSTRKRGCTDFFKPFSSPGTKTKEEPGAQNGDSTCSHFHRRADGLRVGAVDTRRLMRSLCCPLVPDESAHERRCLGATCSERPRFERGTSWYASFHRFAASFVD